MCLVLKARPGDPYLTPQQVLARLQAEFAYVEASSEDGRRYVLEIIQQLQALKHAGRGSVDEAYLASLEENEQNAISVCFGDDLSSDAALLNTTLIPGQPLVFECSSHAHDEAIRTLLARCAAALNYEIFEDDLRRAQ